jgi:hypothetical protein
MSDGTTSAEDASSRRMRHIGSPPKPVLIDDEASIVEAAARATFTPRRML